MTKRPLTKGLRTRAPLNGMTHRRQTAGAATAIVIHIIIAAAASAAPLRSPLAASSAFLCYG